MSSDFRRLLRRIKPHKRGLRLSPRLESDLAFITDTHEPLPKLLPDTTVYIDVLQDRFPIEAAWVLVEGDLWHSTVTEAEMAATCGLLDAGHSGTAPVIERIAETIEQHAVHRILAPDRSVWQAAGILSGLLARLQGYSPPHRQRVLNDALIFCTALKNGCTVLTRNVRDFDLLQQLMPAGKVLFYRRETR